MRTILAKIVLKFLHALPRPNLIILLLSAVLGGAHFAGAYPVAPALALDKIINMAPLIVKAKAISTKPVQDPWFKNCPGFEVSATSFEVISILKGEPGAKTITFHHYAAAPKANQGYMFMPQHYEFTAGRDYILFATNGSGPGKFRQLWADHKDKADQGAFLAADDRPIQTKSVKEACWIELVALSRSTQPDDVVYAIVQLDQMSSGGGRGLTDFPRPDVATALRPLLSSKDSKISLAAISAAGSRNPYLSGDFMFWLATVGKGHFPGIGTRDPAFDNLSGRHLWRELAGIVDSDVPAGVRAMAIRALAKSRVPELPLLLKLWAADTEALVRASAVLLLADVPDEAAQRILQEATQDPRMEVRQAAAQAIGCGQRATLLTLLGQLLKDDSEKVRDAAAMSLLSFSINSAGELLRQNLKDPEYHSLFANALAAHDPAPYLQDLQQIIINNEQPRHWWGGRIPAADSWDILFKYIQSRPAEELRSGKFNAALEALESSRWYSSSEPRDLYALYLQCGLTERARSFRQAVRKKVSYDIDYFFNMADKSPNTYLRN